MGEEGRAAWMVDVDEFGRSPRFSVTFRGPPLDYTEVFSGCLPRERDDVEWK